MIFIDLHQPTPCTYGEAIRALCDNRDRYIQQSAATKDGKLGELPPASNWVRDIFMRRFNRNREKFFLGEQFASTTDALKKEKKS